MRNLWVFLIIITLLLSSCKQTIVQAKNISEETPTPPATEEPAETEEPAVTPTPQPTKPKEEVTFIEEDSHLFIKIKSNHDVRTSPEFKNNINPNWQAYGGICGKVITEVVKEDGTFWYQLVIAGDDKVWCSLDPDDESKSSCESEPVPYEQCQGVTEISMRGSMQEKSLETKTLYVSIREKSNVREEPGLMSKLVQNPERYWNKCGKLGSIEQIDDFVWYEVTIMDEDEKIDGTTVYCAQHFNSEYSSCEPVSDVPCETRDVGSTIRQGSEVESEYEGVWLKFSKDYIFDSQQLVALKREKEEGTSEEIKRYCAHGGSGQFVTPPGVYIIMEKLDSVNYLVSGKFIGSESNFKWRYYPGDNWFIHEAPWNTGGLDEVGGHTCPSRTSRGCINMIPKDSRELFTGNPEIGLPPVEKGTPLVILDYGSICFDLDSCMSYFECGSLLDCCMKYTYGCCLESGDGGECPSMRFSCGFDTKKACEAALE